MRVAPLYLSIVIDNSALNKLVSQQRSSEHVIDNKQDVREGRGRKLITARVVCSKDPRCKLTFEGWTDGDYDFIRRGIFLTVLRSSDYT